MLKSSDKANTKFSMFFEQIMVLRLYNEIELAYTHIYFLLSNFQADVFLKFRLAVNALKKIMLRTTRIYCFKVNLTDCQN